MNEFQEEMLRDLQRVERKLKHRAKQRLENPSYLRGARDALEEIARTTGVILQLSTRDGAE